MEAFDRDDALEQIRRWSQGAVSVDLDGDRGEISAARLLYHARSGSIRTALRYISTPAEMQRRSFRKSTVWAAAWVAQQYPAHGSQDFIAIACAYCGIADVEDGMERFLPAARRDARVFIRRHPRVTS